MAKQQLLTCHCLNVQIIEDLQTNHEINDDKFINDSDELDDFLINSKLIRIRPGGIKINYEYLCLKRIAGENLQIIFCAICEKETHAILISKSSNYRNNDENLMPQSVLVNHSSLLDDKQKIADLKSSSYYSPALDIVLPERLICYKDLNDIKSDSGIGKTFNYDNSFFFISSYIQVDIADKIKSFLQQEKTCMKDRIKRFSFEEEKCFKELAQATQDHRQSFLRMINAIKHRHNIDNDFDKENYLQPIQAPASKDFKYYQAQKNAFDESQTNNKTGKKGDDFDCLFDIDDIDAFVGNGLNLESKVIPSDDDIDDDNLNDAESQATTSTTTAAASVAVVPPPVTSQKQPILNETEYELEEQNTVFPLKEFNTFSNGNLINDETYSQSALPDLAEHHSYRQPRQRQSQLKNINNKSTSNNDGPFQVANSLPIQIPHFSRCKINREIEESFRLNPGESIADSIQKLARSVRNENDILDDRPRRRLNTGDLIKSRPFFS